MLVDKCIVVGESTRYGPRVDIGSLMLVELDAKIGRALVTGC